jgi:hypothetical protein
VSLIGRFFEEKGIPTVAVFLQESMVEQTPAPRMLHVKWPFGNPYGEPNAPELQAMVLQKLLMIVEKAEGFGHLERPDWPWKRTETDLPKEWKRFFSKQVID